MKKLSFKKKHPASDEMPADAATEANEIKTEAAEKDLEQLQPKAKKSKKTKYTGKLGTLMKPIDLLRASTGDYISDWRSYMKIAAVGAIPVGLLNLANQQSPDATTSAYISLALIIINVAVIWSIGRKFETGLVPNVRQAYYEGSVAIVRFIIVSLLLLIILLPVAAVSVVYVFAAELASYFIIDSAQQLATEIVISPLALLTLYWIIRRGLSLIIVVVEGNRPVQAWKMAQRITARRFWPVTARLGVIVLASFIVAIPAVLVLFLCSLVGQSSLGATLFQVIATLTVLPLDYIYLTHMYKDLKATSEVAVTETAT